MWGLLTDPDTFFEQRRRAVQLRWGVTIVVLTSVMAVVGSVYVFYRMLTVFPESARGIVAIGGGVSLFSGFISNLLLWLLLGGVFYLVSVALEGEGEFREVLAVVGWGFVPTLIATTVASVVAIWVFTGVTFPTDPRAVQSFVTTTGRTATPLRLAKLFGVVFTLWRGVLWAFGLKHAMELSLRRAAAIVTLPVIVSVGLSVSRLL